MMIFESGAPSNTFVKKSFSPISDLLMRKTDVGGSVGEAVLAVGAGLEVGTVKGAEL